MKLTLIAEGSTKWERFIKRWGVSFLIGEDVLFDTFGDPVVLLNNMRKFKVDPAKIKHIILSHDDWDHMAGLWHLLPERKDITVYICPAFRQETKNRLASFGVKVTQADRVMEIKENIYSTGEFFGVSDGRKIYEQSVAIKTGAGLALICGCAHPGVVNIARRAKEYFKMNVDMVMGGFHMKDNTDEVNTRIIRELKEIGVLKVAPMHCTGKNAVEVMREEFGVGCVLIKEGDDLEL